MPDRLSNRRRKEIASLVRRKDRQRLGQMLVEGVRAVEAAVEAGAPLVDVLVSSDAAAGDRRVQRLVEQAGVPVYVAPTADLEALSDVEASQGVLAVVRAELAEVEALAEAPRVLVLDGVQDPGNVGTLLRTAAWFGVEGVMGGPGTAGFFNPKVVRAAMGGHWDLRLTRTGNLDAALGRLRSAGFALYGADLGGTSARGWAPRAPSALVLGSEAHGLSPVAQAHLDERVAIYGAATARGAESLNVAVAAGILMHAWQGAR